jgi:hypothetical protein
MPIGNRSEENRSEVGTRMGIGFFLCRVYRLLNESKNLSNSRARA